PRRFIPPFPWNAIDPPPLEGNRDGKTNSSNQACKPLPALPTIAPIPRPVDQESFTSDVVHIHKSPETAIVAPVAIVTHDEKMVFWHFCGTVIITTGRQNVLRVVTFEMRVRILHLLAVDIYFLAADFHCISSDADNSLDKIL